MTVYHVIDTGDQLRLETLDGTAIASCTLTDDVKSLMARINSGDTLSVVKL